MKRVFASIFAAILLVALISGCQSASGSAQQIMATPLSPAEARTSAPVSLPYDSVFPGHEPYGNGIGAMPGRVVWAHNPNSVIWDGSGYWWEPEHFNEAAIQAMVNDSIASLGGRDTAREGWDALFKAHNTVKGKNNGYAAGEKIAIKANINGSAVNDDDISGKTQLSYTNPVLLRALLISLVEDAGITPSDITVYDVSRLFPDYMVALCTDEVLQGVRFVDRGNGTADESSPINWSYTFGGAANYLPTCVTNAEYIVNLANLKGHSYGITLCGKNHFGSFINGNAMRPPEGASLHQFLTRNEMGIYSPLTDLTANAYLGGKTVLYMMDALICAVTEGTPITGDNAKWCQAPFDGHYTASIFVSQDPVAIDSVGADFLINEPAVTEHNPVLRDNPTVENYLHESALVSNPPSGTAYRNGNAEAVKNLGVHEHWNNAIDKQYSRNRGKDEGIELVHINPRPKEDSKALIAYFSHTGNTKTAAEHIQALTGAELFEIKTVNPYPDDYNACLAQATTELEDDFKPELSTRVGNMDKYEVIYIGFPIWHGNTPMAIRSFLEEYDLSGKTVIPFCTSGGSGISQSVSVIRNLCPASDVLEGLCVNRTALDGVYSQIEKWLGGLNINLVNKAGETGERVISITVGQSVFTAKLYDNDTTNQFMELLPTTLPMSELNGNEKYYYLPEKLPSNAQAVGNIRAGDLMLYGSDCLVLFYENFTSSYRYTKIGYIENATGLSDALGNGNAEVSFTE